MSPVLIFKRPRLTGKAATLNVEVTAADIKQGEPLCAQGCPIALAATRAAYKTWGEKHTFDAAVSDMLVIYRTDAPVAEHFIAVLPKEANIARRGFDCRQSMEPFTFAAEGKLRRGTKQ